ncbi:hypothetical protein F4805DRAFT_238054 [Annulohypoxylon moriforme]|nr:hypothetical protein F4805DRAFT_238054 [Annulohypoxylon moriforme]
MEILNSTKLLGEQLRCLVCQIHLDKVGDILSPNLFLRIFFAFIILLYLYRHRRNWEDRSALFASLDEAVVIFVQIFLSHSRFRPFAPPSQLISLSHHDQASLFTHDLPSFPVLLAVSNVPVSSPSRGTFPSPSKTSTHLLCYLIVPRSRPHLIHFLRVQPYPKLHLPTYLGIVCGKLFLLCLCTFDPYSLRPLTTAITFRALPP